MNKITLYSVVIPVYNSETIVTATIDRTLNYFRSNKISFEVILVNDGSTDNSWDVISKLAKENKEIIAINLLHNYGQHNANLCGFKKATGDYVIAMDDDLQNPPEEIKKLIEGVIDGSDLVIGRFKEKKHSFVRRLGSKFVNRINRKVFYGEKDLILSNFRIIHRDVINRVCAYKSKMPYIPGLVLMFSNNRKNVLVEHHAREIGKSNYNVYRIIKLVSIILFNYSSIPLRYMAIFGFVVSGISFLLAVYYFISAIVSGSSAPGWSTLVILISFFNGVLILLISIVGEYVVRLLMESSNSESYYVKEIVE